MGDADNAMPPSKKRAAGKQLSRDDDPDAEEDVCGQETGTFQRASEEILASRRIVKVRRNTSSSRAANPFAGIRLVPPTAPSSVGVSADKTSEIALSLGVDSQHPVYHEEEASKAKNKPSDGKNTSGALSGSETKETESNLSEAKEICETKAAVATPNEAKQVCETKVADVSVNGGDSKGKEEAQPETMEASKENREGNKDDARVSTEKNLEESTENKETAKDEGAEEVHAKVISQQEPAVAVRSFQQLSSTQNAFAGISGTGFSNSSFTFGLLPNPGTSMVSFGSAFSSRSISGSGALFGTRVPGTDGSSLNASNGGASIRLFGAPASENITTSGSSLLGLQEVPVETGEEKEKAVFIADSILFEYMDKAWKERGKGELKVNLSNADTGKARLVMRSKGNYRLILNANLFPDMKLTNMDKRGITFVCMNSAGEAKESLSTFALKFKDSSIVEQFRGVVEANKGNNNSSGDLKTPENSPKDSEV